MNLKINKGTFFVVLIIITAILLCAFYGVSIGSFKINGAKSIRFGIDIRGGAEATFVPKDLDRAPTKSELESTRTILETRLDDKNILDRDVTVDKNNGEVIVRFPWKSDEKDFNPQQAISEIGETALLTFRDSSGKILLEGGDVKHSSAAVDPNTHENVVQLEFNKNGAIKFEEATKALVGQQMGIYMDETLISNPMVNQAITGTQAVITGMQNADEAKELSNKINSGALPFSLESKNYSTISPTLGNGALNIMIYAGLIAFAIVCLFMILYYRLPGLVACIGLTLQMALQILAVSVPQITLTLPGIAGIILSIGMGVDTNIIISERIKEEINDGKTISAAIATGYKRAFSAVFDGNITTVLVAVVLMIFGSGAMLSFGYTLLTGVLLNFISGITCSKLLVTSLSRYNVFKKNFLYGGKANV